MKTGSKINNLTKTKTKMYFDCIPRTILSMDSGSLCGKQLLSKSDSSYCCLGMLQVMAGR